MTGHRRDPLVPSRPIPCGCAPSPLQMSMPPAGGIAVPIPAGRRVCNRGGQWRYVERQKRAAIIARHASAPARLGHKLASTKNWKAMAAPNSAVTVTACGGVGTQCGGVLRPRQAAPGSGAGGRAYIKLEVAHAGVQAILLLLGLGHLRLVLGLLQPAAHLVPVGLGTGFKISGEAEAGEGEGEGVPSPRLAYERCLLLHAALRRSAGALQQHAMTEAWPAEPL